jgi:hypothetical protein
MKFIEVTSPDGAKVLINVFKVSVIQKTNVGPQETVSVTMDDGKTIYVAGKYEDFVSLLEAERM